MKRANTSVARAMLTFCLAGLLILAVVGVAGVLVLRRIGTDEATRQATQLAIVASKVVEPKLKDGIVRGTASSLLALDDLVFSGVLKDPIVHAKVWGEDGTVLYSDLPEQIGQRFDLDGSERTAFGSGDPTAGQSDLARPENAFGEDSGPLLEVSVPVSTPDGTPLLFQAYLRFDSVAASARDLWTSFLPVLAVALVALALLQVPIGYRLARRVRDSQRERESLLARAIESSDLERRRIAADLHDGLVQQLVGLSMSLSAEADTVAANDPAAGEALRRAASETRSGVRSLRSALMGINPPSLHRAGLAAAIADLAAPLADAGLTTELEVPSGLALPAEAESLLFRASREAIRNVAAHARASRVHVRIGATDGHAVLQVEDDGVGFQLHNGRVPDSDGHLGLSLLEDLARDAGGSLSVASTPGEGTRVSLEVPIA